MTLGTRRSPAEGDERAAGGHDKTVTADMTRLELRRLALQATRNPKEWRPVLQDALLEHHGEEFEHAIVRAHLVARKAPRGSFVGVIYGPVLRLGPRNSRRFTYARKFSAFGTLLFTAGDFDYTWPDSWVRILARSGRVPVYFVPTGSKRRAGKP